MGTTGATQSFIPVSNGGKGQEKKEKRTLNMPFSRPQSGITPETAPKILLFCANPTSISGLGFQHQNTVIFEVLPSPNNKKQGIYGVVFGWKSQKGFGSRNSKLSCSTKIPIHCSIGAILFQLCFTPREWKNKSEEHTQQQECLRYDFNQ